MLNYLALLGWSAGDDREVFGRDELPSFFSLERVSRNPAVFDVQKLQWMNQEHFGRLGFGDKVRLLLPAMEKHGLWPPRFRVDLSQGPQLRVVTGSPEGKVAASIQPLSDEEWMQQEPTLSEEIPRLRLVLEALGKRFGGPHDVPLLTYFYSDDYPFDPAAVDKHLQGEAVPELLRALAASLEQVKPFTPENVESTLRELAASRGCKAGQLIHPARVSLTGQAVSPGIFEVFYLLGRPKSVERLRRGADLVEQNRLLPPGPPPPDSESPPSGRP
jgi:glutamyl-tRNA synthetase